MITKDQLITHADTVVNVLSTISNLAGLGLGGTPVARANEILGVIRAVLHALAATTAGVVDPATVQKRIDDLLASAVMVDAAADAALAAKFDTTTD